VDIAHPLGGITRAVGVLARHRRTADRQSERGPPERPQTSAIR